MAETFGFLTDSTPHPPPPPTSADAARWDETARRRRMLEGTWGDDYRTRRKAHLGTTREEATGPTALAINPLRNICSELARLYDEAPQVWHPRLALLDQQVLAQAYLDAGMAQDTTDMGALRRAIIHAELLEAGRLPLEGFQRRLAASGLWSQMPRLQEYALACREYLLVPEVGPGGELSYREAYPDRVVATARPGRPSAPAQLAELRLRTRPGDGETIWTWDLWDGEAGRLRIVEAVGTGGFGRDVTAEYLGRDIREDAYWWRWADGRPMLPHEVYHATRLGDRLWDPYRWVELVEGTLDLAVLYAFTVHVFRDASWPQRYTVNARIAGDSEGGRSEIITDPATVAQFETDSETGGQPLVGQWMPGGDVGALNAVLGEMVQRLAADVGVSLSDVQRVSDASRSGVAISLTNEGKRAAQRRFAPHFRPSDEQLVCKTAALLNRATGSTLPETGWEVRYTELPLSPDEVRSKRENVLALLDRQLLSPAEAYAELRGVTPLQAEAALARIRAQSPAFPSFPNPLLR